MGADDTSLDPAAQSGTDARDSEDDSPVVENRISRTEKMKLIRENLAASRRSIWETASSLPQPTFAMLLQLDVILEYQTKCMAASKASSGNIDRKLEVLKASQKLLDALLAPTTPPTSPLCGSTDMGVQTDAQTPLALATIKEIVTEGNADTQRKLDVILAHVAAQRETTRPAAPTHRIRAHQTLPLNANAREWNGGQRETMPNLHRRSPAFTYPTKGIMNTEPILPQGPGTSGMGLNNTVLPPPPPFTYAEAARASPRPFYERGYQRKGLLPTPYHQRSATTSSIAPPHLTSSLSARFAVLHAPLNFNPELLAQRLRANDFTVFYCTRFEKLDTQLSSIIYLEVDVKDRAKLSSHDLWPTGSFLRKWRGDLPNSLRIDDYSA